MTCYSYPDPFFPLWQTRCDLAAAAAENQVAVRVVDGKGVGGSKAIALGRQMDLFCNLHGPGKATVGIEGEELEGTKAARILPLQSVFVTCESHAPSKRADCC